jgi:hypothetical protein
MSLDTDISLITLDNALAEIGGEAVKDGIWVYCNKTGATPATVEVTDTTIVLAYTSGGVPTSNTLTFALATAHRAVSSNIATVGTSVAHGLIVGSSIIISGMANTAYNGAFIVTGAPTTTHFTFVLVHADEVETADTGGTVTITVSGLVTAINALVTGTEWKAGRIYHSDADSIDLIVCGPLSCIGSANQITLKIKDNYFINELINRASDFLNKFCYRTLKETTYTLERYTATGDKLFIKNYPITEIKQISYGKIDALRIKYTSTTAYNAYARVKTTGIILTVDGTSQAEKTFANNTTLSAMATAITGAGWTAAVASSDYNSWPSSLLFEKRNVFALNEYSYLQVPEDPLDDYEEDLENGIIYLPCGFSERFKDVFISYTAGYSTIPYALEDACKRLVKLKYDMRTKDSALASEKIGSVYAYTLRDLEDGLPKDLLEEVGLFKRRDI